MNTEIPSNAENFYLRFTDNLKKDMFYKKSIWITYEAEKPEGSQGVEAEWNNEFDCWVFPHKGLSGHRLEAQTLEEAIVEVKTGSWFANPKKDNWVIFAGDCAGNCYGADTPEGDDFTPVSVVYQS